MPNMKITLARIDNRLMHGIVMTQYLPSTNSQRIMVIDDATANDALKKQMMNMAKPNGYASSIITTESSFALTSFSSSLGSIYLPVGALGLGNIIPPFFFL